MAILYRSDSGNAVIKLEALNSKGMMRSLGSRDQNVALNCQKLGWYSYHIEQQS